VLGAGRAEASYSVELTVEATQPAQIIPPPGQQIDLMQLFGKPQAPQLLAPEQHQQQFYQQQQNQQPKFASNPDTDFFRTSHSPAVQTQAQQPPPQRAPTQQNMLLDMFNSARRG
jgi:hypothetical protein